MDKKITLGELARKLGATLIGDPNLLLYAVADLAHAKENEISFLSNPKFEVHLAVTKASAVIVNQDTYNKLGKQFSCALLIMENTYLGYAKTAQMLDNTPTLKDGFHTSAIIADTAKIDPSVRIAENVVIGEGVVIESGVQIGANSVIGDYCTIKRNSRLWANVTLYHRVHLGENTIIHSGTILGSDGFGYAQQDVSWVKIPQVGSVQIGNDVEIGANCCIDRGALGATQIGKGVKIDNMVHIAHNVIVGDDCAMAGCVAIAGSSEIGARTTLAGGVGILGHLKIAQGSHFTARTLVNKSNEKAGIFSGGTGMMPNKEWRKSVARFRQLDDMAKKIKELEKQLQLMANQLPN
ncbi:MAG: UDP-3-O-(3-hydroxymyristoyl)glucosamine N-acyltransferase [Gammaproteobacteria bacterium CG22_combo_CG10-13_8_21_14_all_40_8]|nr:MAG: UDP-3-O-(3-hydroxymyristoyl)glucosamine N-acyltransferase [Gammaproteobacteria bacterium CG22_combo_CG10-13_8_21_14_all_40_8]